MFIEPQGGALAQIALIAAFAVVGGSMQFAFVLELRSIAKDVEHRSWQPSRTKPTARKPATES